MRIHIGWLAATIAAAACSSSPNAGPLGEGMAGALKIVAVDTSRPPRSVAVELDEPSYVAVLLVAPGHSATLLYPRDSVTSNRFEAGVATVSFEVPGMLVRSDSALVAARRNQRVRNDSVARVRSRIRTGQRPQGPGPLPPDTPTYLLLVTSPQPLAYQRLIERTAGVSIPLVESEALNAIGKAIRSTLLSEPRTLSAYYQLVELSPLR